MHSINSEVVQLADLSVEVETRQQVDGKCVLPGSRQLVNEVGDGRGIGGVNGVSILMLTHEVRLDGVICHF